MDEWLDPTSPLVPIDLGSFPGLNGANPGMWGFNTTPTIMKGNRIVGNSITGFLQTAWDGGAIYTTGFQDGDPADLGLDGTVIADNYAYDKTTGAGGNVIYTDGGSRYLDVENNILFGNPTGTFNYGPGLTGPLNTLNPFNIFPLADTQAYGSDIGGCVTYGDILYADNRWENWWTTNPFAPFDPSAWPSNPIYYDPGSHGTQSNPIGTSALPGAPYPTGLDFSSNIQIGGPAAPVPGITAGKVLAFTKPTALSVVRADDQGGLVTFGVESLDDGHIETLLQDAEGRNAGALAYETATGGTWRASEGKAIGTATSVPGQLAAGVWLPTATENGVALTLNSLQTDGNSALATFDNGVQATYDLGGTRSIPNPSIAPDEVVTVKRLGYASAGLAFYQADQRTGAIVSNGQTYLPGDAGYLDAALANAEAANTVIAATDMPAYGQEKTFDSLPLNDTVNYGVLLLLNQQATIFSSYSAANPHGDVQMMSVANPAGGVAYGIEDIAVSNPRSDRDYNDVIVTVGHTP
jgi:hypothetical protein